VHPFLAPRKPPDFLVEGNKEVSKLKALFLIVLAGVLVSGCFGGGPSEEQTKQLQEAFANPHKVCIDGWKFYCVDIPAQNVCFPTTHVLTAEGKPIACGR
jgi:hypothetical protein